jgi:hypothetical protein
VLQVPLLNKLQPSNQNYLFKPDFYLENERTFIRNIFCVWVLFIVTYYWISFGRLYRNHPVYIFLFDTVRIWEISPVWADFDKCHNLSKRNVKLIVKILGDVEPLRGSSNKKTLYSTRSCVNWAFFWNSWAFKLAHSCQKSPIYTRTR